MAGGNCNQTSFTYTLNTPGCYIFHKRHSDGCGYCWDNVHGASCGCSNCTVTVNVSSTALSPPTSVTANPVTICSGGTSQLNAISGGTNITWWNAASGGGSYGTSASGANFAVNPVTTTIYYAESNATSCTSATRTPVTVTVVADPAATISGTTSICEGAVATYSVSGVTGGTGSASYQWYFKSPSGTFAALNDGSSNAPCYASVLGATTSALTLGLYNFSSACSGYQVYCIVTYNGNGCNAATSNTITTTVNAPVGNPAVFGNGIWNVYAYSGGNIDLTGTYYGYYTESNLSYNTLDRWCTTCSPSDASGWQGCYVSIDNHVVVSKRTNFTCGYYQLDMPNHDDDVRVYINGSLVWSHEPGCCDAHTNIWTGYLTASSTIEVRHLEGGGGSHQSLTITPVGTSTSTAPTSISGSTSICTGGSTTLTQVGGNLANGAEYKWYSGSCGGTLVGTGNSFTTPVLTSSTLYYVRAEGTCNTTGCASTTVTVSSQPTASAGGSQTICVGSTAVVSGASSSNGTIAWTENGAGSITSGAATLTPTYTSAAGDAGNTVTLTMTVSNSPCSAATATYTVVVKAQPAASAGGSQAICAGSTATVSGASSSNGTIAWTENGAGSITSGAATLTPTYTSAAGDAGNTVTLTMTVSNSPCSAATATYTVNVTGPSSSSPTALADGDYVWTGYINQYWATPSNWIIYNSGLNNFSVASAAPLGDKNVFFRNYGAPSCVSNTAHLATGTTGSCNNITIETNLTMDASSTLNVSGSWTSNGAFGAGSGTVTFNGASAQTIRPGGSNFNNVVFNNTAAGNTDINIFQPMMINGSGTFTNGIVYYSGTGSLTFANGASSNGGSATSFVNNTVTKSGTNAFIFPVGEVVASSAYWAPVGIAAPAASSNITAQYKFDIPHDDGGNIIENYNSWMMCDPAGLHHASGVEYWKMTSDNSEPAITLYWKDASRSQITYLPDLCVAHYEDCDGAGPGTAVKWANKGGDPNASGTLGVGGIGSVSSTIPFNSYSPVTFGTRNSTNPLPISLLSFNAVCENNKVDITWATATETNNDYFTIQRSLDASGWEYVKTIPGGGNSNSTLYYSATDADPLSGTSYYRLKQTDFNGQSASFSPVVVVCGDVQDKQSISYYPNPFTSEVMVDLRNINYEKAVLRIYDLLGEKVYEMILTSNESINLEVKMDLHSLPAGVYCAVFSSDGYSNTSKIVKNY